MVDLDFIGFRTLGYNNNLALLNINGVVSLYTQEGLTSLIRQFEQHSDQALTIEIAINDMKRLKPGTVAELQEDDLSGQGALF